MHAVSEPDSPRTLVIEGLLSGGKWLKEPIEVIVEDDGDEVLVHEPRFHIHASGESEDAALSAFRAILGGYVDVLGARESSLGPHLRDQLACLRSIIGAT